MSLYVQSMAVTGHPLSAWHHPRRPRGHGSALAPPRSQSLVSIALSHVRLVEIISWRMPYRLASPLHLLLAAVHTVGALPCAQVRECVRECDPAGRRGSGALCGMQVGGQAAYNLSQVALKPGLATVHRPASIEP